MIGHRKGGVDTQFADVKLIPNSSAPSADSGADQIFDAGNGATLKDKGGFQFPLVTVADGLGVVTIGASDSPYQLTELHRRVLVNTTDGAVTVKLPASSAVRVGHTIEIVDDKRQFAVNNCTVDGNGTNINGAATYVLSQQDACATFTKASSTWETSSGGGSSGSLTGSVITATTRVVTPTIGTDGSNQHGLPGGTDVLAGASLVGTAFVAGSNAATDVIGAATKYVNVLSATATVAASQVVLGMANRSGFVRRLQASLKVAPGGADTVVFTVQKSSDQGATWSDTTLTATISAAAKTAFASGPSGTIATGDLLAVKLVSSAGTAAGPMVCFDNSED